ncbi:unnamed protein product [Schistocephalus solidus]|uniref:Uncharacterized protein n=1 Tax=Schistocephalus solidus TaxID=70667 RepID=A0A183SSQ3_SCHSO|nr:unnamed protein product [Schistocephalus solidus]
MIYKRRDRVSIAMLLCLLLLTMVPCLVNTQKTFPRFNFIETFQEDSNDGRQFGRKNLFKDVKQFRKYLERLSEWVAITGRPRFFPAATLRAPVTTGELNQVRVSGVVRVFTPGTSAPFPPFLPSSVLPALPPLLFPPPPLFPPTSPSPPPLSSSSYSCFYPSSSPSILTLPSFSTVEKSYGEGDMQSRRRHRKIGRSLTNPNRDPKWSSVAA